MTSLRTYFRGTAFKYLSSVDATPSSNQHEIGSNKFTAILGNPGSEKLRFKATFLYFDPATDSPEACVDEVTYYDTRLNQPLRSAEFRLYYHDNPVTEQIQAGDFCLIGARTDGSLLIAFAHAGGEDERRLRYLFDVENARAQWTIQDAPSNADLDFARTTILEALGIELEESADELHDQIVSQFGLRFPPTKEFSSFARASLPSTVDARADPDRALEEWMRQEERLFRTLERAIVQKTLDDGFPSVDSFVSFSLSVQNRRKSRAGHALENHLSAIFSANKVRFERGAKTEGNSRPDFIFPSAAAYHAGKRGLVMLAAKSTCKDRWRQILAEATRIPTKHLCTLETSISENQTDEMTAHSVILVLPRSVARTYTESQRRRILSVHDFVHLVARPE
jgi:hypothetical protein